MIWVETIHENTTFSLSLKPGPVRDYNDEFDGLLTVMDCQFKIEELAIYLDHAPKAAEPNTDERICQVDDKVSDLCRDARKAQYEADTLSLARDVAQLGNLFKEVSKTEHAHRTEKILHLKNQNTIGAAIVGEYMGNNLAIHSGPPKDQINLLERVGVWDTTF